MLLIRNEEDPGQEKEEEETKTELWVAVEKKIGHAVP